MIPLKWRCNILIIKLKISIKKIVFNQIDKIKFKNNWKKIRNRLKGSGKALERLVENAMNNLICWICLLLNVSTQLLGPCKKSSVFFPFSLKRNSNFLFVFINHSLNNKGNASSLCLRYFLEQSQNAIAIVGFVGLSLLGSQVNYIFCDST